MGPAGGSCPRRPIAAPASPRALAEDCRRAEVVVTLDRPRGCAAPLLIDRSMLWRHGSLAARRTAGGWVVDKARPYGHVRHWHVPPDIVRR
ncbi:hypothetical protein [Acuticoccus kandeliae]|uniref:hypothetical protein n=1 Tax=Acuticoccus kandeliae TaxID=2073160 RepID=UPI001300B985|nr:hypothetical protein [Acuticoccus kandeliae]